MCSVFVSCFDVSVMYWILSYTTVVLYLLVSASLSLTYSDPSHIYKVLLFLVVL